MHDNPTFTAKDTQFFFFEKYKRYSDDYPTFAGRTNGLLVNQFPASSYWLSSLEISHNSTTLIPCVGYVPIASDHTPT
jgi:hypothetical protein